MQLPVAMTIAGSDNSAGAGAQADLKTMSALQVYGVTAITCVVAEVPGRVSAIQAIEPGIVAEQIRLLFQAFPIGAVKTGMLYSAEIIESVLAVLMDNGVHAGGRVPLVVDPVMVATSGDPLLKLEAISLYRDKLLPIATLATPNMDEVRVLLDAAVAPRDVSDLREAGHALVRRYGCAFLVKGGHLREANATDLLIQTDGSCTEFSAPYVSGVSTHGTGCTTSAAVAAELAKGLKLTDAVAAAKRYVHRAIANYLRWERPSGATDALHHFASEE
jgi:hydroxymethylpyrimidine/phosphomethylpyrimidine kinase